MPDPETLEGIAIVGMSGRFPGGAAYRAVSVARDSRTTVTRI